MQGDELVLVLGPVVEAVPVDEDAHGGDADVAADDHEPDQRPVVDERLVVGAGLLLHHVGVGRVEGERRGRQPVGDQVDPQQLNRVEAVGHAQEGGQKDGHHLADVGRDHVADEGLR